MNIFEFESLAQNLIDKLFSNDKFGSFEIIVRTNIDDLVYYKTEANVVYKHNEDQFCHIPVIIVEKDNMYQDFYYDASNCCWKPLTEVQPTGTDMFLTFGETWSNKDLFEHKILPVDFEDTTPSGMDNVLEFDDSKILDIEFE